MRTQFHGICVQKYSGLRHTVEYGYWLALMWIGNKTSHLLYCFVVKLSCYPLSMGCCEALFSVICVKFLPRNERYVLSSSQSRFEAKILELDSRQLSLCYFSCNWILKYFLTRLLQYFCNYRYCIVYNWAFKYFYM